jgi:hypothetical protein
VQTPMTDTGESTDYNLLQLLKEVRNDGRIVEHFVCYDCRDLVERDRGSMDVHQCTARGFFLGALRGTVSALSPFS